MAKTRSGAITEDVLNRILDEKLNSLANKEDVMGIIETQNAIISSQSKRIEILESTVSMLQRHVEVLTKVSDANEQYSRRTCIRITGIPPVERETAEDVLEKVKGVFEELEVSVPDACIDRAHRIGKKFKKGDAEIHPVICKFTTWRHRTKVYQKRRATSKYTISLDLTKRRLELLKSAREIVKSFDFVDFVFADINCQLKIKFKNNKFVHFESEAELNELLISNAPSLQVSVNN